MKEVVGFNFKKSFRKLNEKFTANKSKNMCIGVVLTEVTDRQIFSLIFDSDTHLLES